MPRLMEASMNYNPLTNCDVIIDLLMIQTCQFIPNNTVGAILDKVIVLMMPGN